MTVFDEWNSQMAKALEGGDERIARLVADDRLSNDDLWNRHVNESSAVACTLAIRPHSGGAKPMVMAHEAIVALLERLGYKPPLRREEAT